MWERQAGSDLRWESGGKEPEGGAAACGNTALAGKRSGTAAFLLICTVTRAVGKKRGGAVCAAGYLDLGAECVRAPEPL